MLLVFNIKIQFEFCLFDSVNFVSSIQGDLVESFSFIESK